MHRGVQELQGRMQELHPIVRQVHWGGCRRCRGRVQELHHMKEH